MTATTINQQTRSLRAIARKLRLRRLALGASEWALLLVLAVLVAEAGMFELYELIELGSVGETGFWADFWKTLTSFDFFFITLVAWLAILRTVRHRTVAILLALAVPLGIAGVATFLMIPFVTEVRSDRRRCCCGTTKNSLTKKLLLF